MTHAPNQFDSDQVEPTPANDAWLRDMKEPEKQELDNIFAHLDSIVKDAVGQEAFDKLPKHPPRWRGYDKPAEGGGDGV